jgi:hypothetical protein
MGLQIHQQVKDLSLGRDVEASGGFIQNDELWVTGKCHGDDDALLLPTAQLVWVFLEDQLRIWQADQLEQVEGPLPGLLARTDVAVLSENFDNLFANPHTWAEGSGGILGYQSNLATTHTL